MEKMNDEVQVHECKINIGGAVKQSIGILKANFILLLVTSVLTAVVTAFSSYLLYGPMAMGMFVVCDNLILAREPKAEIGDLFKGLSFIVSGFVLNLLSGCGVLLCGVGVLVTAPIGCWAMMRIVDTGMPLSDSVKDAFGFVFTRKNYSLLLLWFVADVLAGIGVILCGVGIFLTLPLLFLIPMCAYRQIYPQGAER